MEELKICEQVSTEFKPDDFSYEYGLERIETAYKKLGFDPTQKVITSKDGIAIELIEDLKATFGKVKLPNGFEKFMLPFTLPTAKFFISIGDPNAFCPKHSHAGSSVRFIIYGSITYNGIELSAGDWMYIPKGAEYSFTVGNKGVTTVCGYHNCCC